MRLELAVNCSILLLGFVVADGRVAVVAAEGERPKEASAVAKGTIVARVNGEPISKERMDAEVGKNSPRFRNFGVRKEDPERLKQMQRSALDSIINDEVLAQESRKQKIGDIEEKVAQKLKALEARFGAGEGMERYMKRRSITLEDLKKSLRARIYVEEYLRKRGILEPEIPEDLIRRTYQENPSSYQRDETVRVSHILIAVDERAAAEAQEKARQKAEQVRGEILKGKDFAEMAKKHSNCNSASGGGDLGFVKKGFMPKEFDQAAFAAKQGAVSEVVKSKFGYHVIKVFDKTAAGVAPYEEVRDFIRKYLQSQESKKRLAAHVVELKKKSKIEVLLK